MQENRGQIYFSDDEGLDEEQEEEIKTLSKSKARKARRMTVAQLKQVVHRPDLVEVCLSRARITWLIHDSGTM